MIFDLFKNLDQKIVTDQKKLIAHLKSADIRTLIIEIDNKHPFSENIIKKRKRDRSRSSEDSPSYFANKISNELNDPSLKPQLIELLHEKEFKPYHIYVLRCLSNLCSNTNDYLLFDFLISYLKQSKKSETITNVLSRLQALEKPKTVNIDYLKDLLIEGTLQNKTAALYALSNCEHPELEDLLIQEFKTGNQDIKCSICVTLRTTGSEKSFDVLMTEHKRTRSNDLRYFIESSIKAIKERMNTN